MREDAKVCFLNHVVLTFNALDLEPPFGTSRILELILSSKPHLDGWGGALSK